MEGRSKRRKHKQGKEEEQEKEEEKEKEKEQEEEKEQQQQDACHVLFVGNSLTTRHDVPSLVAQLAVWRGTPIATSVVARGGASLRQHINGGAVQQRLQQTRATVLCLQEMSTGPIKSNAAFQSSVRDCVAMAIAQDPKTRVVLYCTWAQKTLPQQQAILSDNYARAGRDNAVTVAFAGDAFAPAQSAGFKVYDKDNRHASLLGAYLAACVLFTAMFDESPCGAPAPKGITKTDAQSLQKIAFDTQNSKRL